jgi:DNA-binding MarR family transcriptional regulator
MASKSVGNADSAKMWSFHYRLISSVIAGVAPAIADLGLEVKELFMLAEIDDHPHPAELAGACLMPKPTVTLYVKRLEAAGYLKREIDSTDLRRHRLTLTTDGRKVMARGMLMLTEAFGQRVGRLNTSEQEALHALLEKLV